MHHPAPTCATIVVQRGDLVEKVAWVSMVQIRRNLEAKGALGMVALLVCVLMASLGIAMKSPGGAVAAVEHTAHKLSDQSMYLVRGLDRPTHRLFVEDYRQGLLISDDWGRSFSEEKEFPPGIRSVSKVILFRGWIYAAGRSTQTGRVEVYRARPAAADQPLHWQGPKLVLGRGATALGTDIAADGRFLYVGEYGDPKRGPRVYRSANGRDWTTVFGRARHLRHIHGIATDPYRPGHVWMTVGDGGEALYRSKRHGARGTWKVVLSSSHWQSVQISFARRGVFLAADNHSDTFFVVNRRTLRARVGTPDYFADIHPPGSPRGTRYLPNAFFGSVDPGTGAYYAVANDDSEGGATGGWQGFFKVPRVGARVRVVDPGGRGISMNGEVFIGGGRIWSGQWYIEAAR